MALPPQAPSVGAPSPGSSTFNTCSRCPALTAPAARAASGVPIGLQIVGRNYDGTSVFAPIAYARGHRFHETTVDRSHRARRTA